MNWLLSKNQLSRKPKKKAWLRLSAQVQRQRAPPTLVAKLCVRLHQWKLSSKLQRQELKECHKPRVGPDQVLHDFVGWVKGAQVEVYWDVHQASCRARWDWVAALADPLRAGGAEERIRWEWVPSFNTCCDLMRFLRWNGKPKIDIFANGLFSTFKASLDAEMKRLQAKGVGSKIKQVEN